MTIKKGTLQIRLEPDLILLIDNAVRRTGLSKSELLRRGLRKGIPAVVQALEGPPRKTLIDALLALKGLDIPQRRHRIRNS